MSTELKDTQPAADVKRTADELAQSSGTARKMSLQRWRQPRIIAAVTVAVVLVVVAVVGFNLVGRQYTPDGAVRQYLGALQSGDVAGAWSQIQVAAPAPGVSASFTDQQAMRASLAAGKPDIRSFDITHTSTLSSSTAEVDFSYRTSSGAKQAKFVLQRSGDTRLAVFPIWQIEVAPTVLQLQVPAGTSGVSIDGHALSLPAGRATIAVLPLFHALHFPGSELIAPADVSIDAFFSAGQAVAYQPKLTSAGLDKVKVALKAGFDVCSRQTSGNAADSTPCPQALSHSSSDVGLWTLIGDPTADMAIIFDQALNASAQGHFQMVFTYQAYGTRHDEPAGGGYQADLVLGSSDVTVAKIQPATGLPQLQRPAAATDQALEALVSSAMRQCAAARTQFVADCPQAIGAAGATNVRWTLAGDPLSSALVTFDPNGGLFTVHGNFQMSATYVWLGNRENANSFITFYDAYLFWDGQALVLVSIDGSSG